MLEFICIDVKFTRVKLLRWLYTIRRILKQLDIVDKACSQK